MPKYLMDYCLNNRKSICNYKVNYSRWPEECRRSSYIPQFPIGTLQEELDEICEHCSHAFFVIELKCPFCDTIKLLLANPAMVMMDSKLGKMKYYHYYCQKCRRDLYRRNEPIA